MVGAVGAFALMVACVKLASAELEAVELVFWRSWVAVPLALAFARRRPRSERSRPPLTWRALLEVTNRRVMLLRCLLGFAAMLCFYTAARSLSVADLNLVGRLQPIVIAVAAPLLLGRSERAPGSVWAVLTAGLFGCAILLGPQLQLGQVGGLWALGAVAFSSGAHTSLRVLGATERPAVVVVWFQVAALLLSALSISLWPGLAWRLPPLESVPWLVGIGLCATLGQVLMTTAYQADRAATVAAASHVGPVWGVLIDLLVFAAWPGPSTLLGGTVVMGAVLWLILRPGPVSPRPARSVPPP